MRVHSWATGGPTSWLVLVFEMTPSEPSTGCLNCVVMSAGRVFHISNPVIRWDTSWSCGNSPLGQGGKEEIPWKYPNMRIYADILGWRIIIISYPARWYVTMFPLRLDFWWLLQVGFRRRVSHWRERFPLRNSTLERGPRGFHATWPVIEICGS